MTNIVRYSAAGGVVVDDGRMLLLDRPLRGEVRLPKGHIEPDESPAVTALRETAEETGYPDLSIVAELGEQVVEFDFKGKHIVRQETYFLMRLVSHRLAPRPTADAEQFRVRWVSLAEAVAQLTYPAEQAMARRAISALERLARDEPS
jgi:8-oxo-dGTP pyrophosphatase MutT (NUDIX family)